jgi:ATP-dependent RNA helicase DHX8/PRP22
MPGPKHWQYVLAHCAVAVLVVVVVVVPLSEDDDGLLPEWVVYHELVSTSRPFLRQVGGA